MKKLRLQLVTENKKLVEVTVEARESDAFLENGNPDADYLEYLAEKESGVVYLELMSYEILK